MVSGTMNGEAFNPGRWLAWRKGLKGSGLPRKGDSKSTMKATLIKRLLQIILTLLGITLITFLIIQLAPGNPALCKLRMAGGGQVAEKAISKQFIEQTRQLYALDEPLHPRYELRVKRVITFDFGTSPGWGDMLSRSRDCIELAWWLTVFPGAAIFPSITAHSLVGKGLRDAMDPKLFRESLTERESSASRAQCSGYQARGLTQGVHGQQDGCL
jgi:hypothetical protein